MASGGVLEAAALHRLAVGTMTALVAIHQAGTVHGDLRPGSVLFGDKGEDFIFGTFGNDSLDGGQGDDFLNGDLPFPPDGDGSTPPGAFEDPTPNADTCEGGAGTDAETFCELQTGIETHPDPSTVILPA